MSVEPDEIEQILIKTARLTEENNKILRRMQRAQRTATLMRVLHWVVIIGSFAVLYYLIQPYIAEVQALTESYRNILESGTSESSSYDALENFLDNFNLSGEESSVEEGVTEGVETPVTDEAPSTEGETEEGAELETTE